jgi:hypothetical protein
MKIRRSFSVLLSLFAVLALGLAVAPGASASVAQNGSGLGVADDDWDFAGAGNYSMPALGDGLHRLNPEWFRLQTLWNTTDRPEWVERTKRMIERVKSLGVTKIALTIRSNNPGNVDPSISGDPAIAERSDYFPTRAQYKTKIQALVAMFGSQVDAWGPANEPNLHWRPEITVASVTYPAEPLPASLAAAYYGALNEVVDATDPGALVTSPDFVDQTPSGWTPWKKYIEDYVNLYGGSWGDLVAWHPYNGIKAKSMTSTNELSALMPAGKTIWVTELGSRQDVVQNLNTQNEQVSWMINTLGAQSRITRMFYYHMLGHTSGWDSGLLNPDASPRPAWFTYCNAIHGNNDPRCSFGDFSGDGKSDILGRKADGTLWLYRGNGASGWDGAPVQVGLGWDQFDVILAPGDFNSDGRSDILARRASDGTLWLYRGNAASGWMGEKVKVGEGWGGFTSLFTPGDFNSDGNPDVLARQPDGGLLLYRGDGGTSWINPNQAGLQIGWGWNMFDRIVGPGDFNGDNKVDVMARKPDGTFWLYPGNGALSWLPEHQVDSGWNVFQTILGPGDFSGDGQFPDLLASKPDGTLWQYKGNGLGTLTQPATQIGLGWEMYNQLIAVGGR